MKAQSDLLERRKVVDEIIDSATALPLESQNTLLMMAKAMRHTRACMLKRGEIKRAGQSPKQTA